MEDLKVLHQKNVYFLDLNKEIYSGFVETDISTTKENLKIGFSAFGLEIEDVLIQKNSEFVKTEYEITKKEEIVSKHKKEFHSKFWNEISAREANIIINIEEAGEHKIRIIYNNTEENTAIYFHKRYIEKDKHKELVASNHLFRSSSIFPCIEDLRIRHSWELIYIIPSDEELCVVSPGTLQGLKEEKNVLIYSFLVENSHSGNINFCVGTFDTLELLTGDDKKLAYVPSKMIEAYKEPIKEMGSDIHNFIKFTEFFVQSEFPFKELNVVLTMNQSNLIVGQNTAFVSLSSIPTLNIIDQNFAIKEIFAQIVCSQYFPVYLSPTENADWWLFQGLKEYLIDQCLRSVFGNNDFYFSFFKDKGFLIKNDVEEFAIFDKRRSYVSCFSEFFKKKSKMFLHVLENNLSKAFIQKIISICLKRKEINTFDFIKVVKDVTGKDTRPLFDVYVFKPGLIILQCSFEIEKKKNKVSFNIKQKPTSVRKEGNKKFYGNVNVRSHEIEGTFEHSFNLNAEENIFYYHTRTKKTKKKKVEEEKGEEEDIMPMLWVRIDPKSEYLGEFILEQPDYMNMEQLLNEKSVMGQLEALKNLEKKPSEQICSTLERIVNDNHIFYKVRIEALYVLSQCIVGLDFFGFQRIIQFFIKKYCIQGSTIVKPNDFSSFVFYFLQKHLASALSLSNPETVKKFQEREVRTKNIVSAFLLNILRYNDNSTNLFSDAYYISSVIESISYPVCSHSYISIDPFVNEIERLRKFDLVFPSYLNLITRSCVLSLGRMAAYGLLETSEDSLLLMCSKVNFLSVRLAAIEVICILYTERNLDFLVDLVFTDLRIVKIFILKNFLILLKYGKLNLKNRLERFKNEFYDFCCKIFYDDILVDLLVDIIYFIEDKELRVEDKRFLVSREEVSSEEEFKIKFEVQEIVEPTTAVIKLKQPEGPKRIKIRDYSNYEQISEGVLIKFKFKENTVNLKERNFTDISIVLIQNLINQKNSSKISNFIETNRKGSNFFVFKPLTFTEILENIASYASESEFKLEVYRTFVFILTYSNYNSNIYNSSKSLLSIFEKESFDSFKIPDKFIRLNENLKIECIKFITELEELPVVEPFLSPVDYKEMGLIKYVDIVRKPVDLGTIKTKLVNNEYKTLEVVLGDLNRVFMNCCLFNERSSEIFKVADELKLKVKNFITEIYKKEKEMEKVLGLEILEEAIMEVINFKDSAVFVERVDENIVKGYNETIKKQMYLNKIIMKLKDGEYFSRGDLMDDFNLILKNCVIFNGSSSVYSKMCRSMINEANRVLKNVWDTDLLEEYKI